METTKLSKMNMVIAASLLVLGIGCASKQAAAEASHEEHHPEAQAPQKKDESSGMMGQGSMMGKEGMMGQMDMNQMMGMMHECMEMHKDGKMCEHQTMEQCNTKMGKEECQKMMKEVKKDEKKSKSKK